MPPETEVLEGELVPAVITQSSRLFGTDDPELIVVKAAAVSVALAHVVRDRKLFARISGKEHVLVGGWTLLGSMLGVFPVTVWSRPLAVGPEDVGSAERRLVAEC